MGLNPADSVDRYINTSFDEVKKVADNIDTVVNAGEIADTHQVAAADPILRGDGSALQTGDTYFNTTVDIRYTYTIGLTWVAESTHDAAIVATAASQAAAAISETNAATSESNAATSETNAGIAKTAAEVAQTAAELAEANVTADLSTFVSGIGANVISTAALPLINDGNQFTVTGVIAITSMNTVAVGKVVFLTFDAILTLTHHVSNLILPGGADIVTASGDVGIFQEYAIGNWRCLNYQQAVMTIPTPLLTKVIDIGDWNMLGFNGAVIPHGLTLANIRSCQILIRHDNNGFYYDFAITDNGVGSQRVWLDTLNVDILRGTGGFFDNAIFSSLTYNRGWVILTYVP